MLSKIVALAASLFPVSLVAAPIVADVSGVVAGPISVAADGRDLQVNWADADGRKWKASFSLNSSQPLIGSIAADGKAIVEGAKPVYRCSTGKRVGGWDAFFDFPPRNPGGTRSFLLDFHPAHVSARTVGDRVEVTFDGMKMGIFSGSLRYDFYPGSSLIQQEALLSTTEPDTAYFYDAGLQMTAEADRRPGLNMASEIVYDDAEGKLRTVVPPYGSERHTLQVRYRAVAARAGGGSIVAFPSPHRYLFARDYSTNLGFSWYSAWRGQLGLGIQQPPDDNTGIYPWMNAPPGTQQEMGIFFLLSADAPAAALERAKAYTHADRYPHLEGFATFAPHWHFAFTEQQVANGPAWQPPFKQELEDMGVDSAMIMDFHIEGHPRALTEVRLQELDAYYKACRAQSDKSFLLIPAEEADVILGGHWGLVFPKPVFWFMDRLGGEPFKSVDPKHGTVYRAHTPDEMWKMITEEGGYAYQTHPRTKGSTGYPDKILDTAYFRSPRYLGVGWKAMPSDLSSPRLGDRGFKVLDELNNLGLRKIAIGEVDLFQTSSTDELYSQMNLNYLRLKELPDFDHYDRLLESLAAGDGFISTGEVMLPRASIRAQGDAIRVSAQVSYTFPLRIAEIAWGDGKQTHRKVVELATTREFGHQQYEWTVDAPRWTWARLAVWDVAGGGAFTNPTWRAR